MAYSRGGDRAVLDRIRGGYRIFVGDLGNRVGKYELERKFKPYGPITDVWVARNPPGFAFLVYKYAEDAETAVRDLDGRLVCGRRVRVEHARPYQTRRPRGASKRNRQSRTAQRSSRNNRSRSRSGSRERDYSRSQKRLPSRSRSRSRSWSRSETPDIKIAKMPKKLKLHVHSRNRSESSSPDKMRKSRSLTPDWKYLKTGNGDRLARSLPLTLRHGGEHKKQFDSRSPSPSPKEIKYSKKFRSPTPEKVRYSRLKLANSDSSPDRSKEQSRRKSCSSRSTASESSDSSRSPSPRNRPQVHLNNFLRMPAKCYRDNTKRRSLTDGSDGSHKQ